MKHKLDIETWNRKAHFNFFNQFDEPFHGVCVHIDCTLAYADAKANGVSFFLYTVYKCLAAAQMTEPFKMRVEGDEVFVYDTIGASPTVARDNGTFGYGYLEYHPDFITFIADANIEVARVKGRTDLELSPREDLIRFSSLPWIDFTSLSHARSFTYKNSCPMISFGKMTVADGKRTMPLSIHVNHALVDGLHVAQYIECLQNLLDTSV